MCGEGRRNSRRGGGDCQATKRAGGTHLDAVHVGANLLQLAVASRGKAVEELRRGHDELVHQRRRDLVVDGTHLRQIDFALHPTA